jgi:hypothetical protein
LRFAAGASREQNAPHSRCKSAAITALIDTNTGKGRCVMGIVVRQHYATVAWAILAGTCASVVAQDFNFVTLNGNGRQIFEIRLTATDRVPPSGVGRAGFVSIVLTAGPTPGTTALAGALLDGATLINGGPSPSYVPILASGSAFFARRRLSARVISPSFRSSTPIGRSWCATTRTPGGSA